MIEGKAAARCANLQCAAACSAVRPRHMTAFLISIGVVALAAALAVGLSVLVSAPPAAAAYSISFNPSNGKVGVAQQLKSTVNSGAIGVAPGKVDYFAGGAKVATASTKGSSVCSGLLCGALPVFLRL